MKIYYPTNFGDINLEEFVDGNKKYVMLSTAELTLLEQNVLKEILSKYKGKYIDHHNKSLEHKKFEIEDIKIENIHNFMKRKLKKDKMTITAIKFKDGKIELSEEVNKKDVEKAVTVEKPKRGCPMPEYMKSEMRASKVLKEFLSEQQIKDFESNKQFISIGNYTAHPYIITSRWSPRVTSVGQVYDLISKEIICANVMDIPPAEEMLSLKLSVELNEKEFVGKR